MSVARCANPECRTEFRKLGQGKLFVKTLTKGSGSTGPGQKVAWLCNQCCDQGYDLRFDRKTSSFALVSHRKAA